MVFETLIHSLNNNAYMHKTFYDRTDKNFMPANPSMIYNYLRCVAELTKCNGLPTNGNPYYPAPTMPPSPAMLSTLHLPVGAPQPRQMLKRSISGTVMLLLLLQQLSPRQLYQVRRSLLPLGPPHLEYHFLIPLPSHYPCELTFL